MTRQIIPGRAAGTVQAPPSKSMAHRLLICAGLCQEESTISGLEFSEDILATIDCLEAMGASIRRDTAAGRAIIRGTNPRALIGNTVLRLPCRESGSTMRFMLPLALLGNRPVFLEGKGRLPQRPMDIYEEICIEQGLQFTRHNNGIEVCGPLRAGKFSIAGNTSSQFLTGLLFALPLLSENSSISLTTSLESKPYVDMTVEAMKKSKVSVSFENVNIIHILGGQHFHSMTEEVEGDYSNTAFWEALNILNGNVSVSGLLKNSKQGDKVYQEYFYALQNGTPTLSVKDCPDLAPILMVMAAACHGAVLTDTQRLKLKESDRGHVMAQELRKFGAVIDVDENQITVHSATLHKPDSNLFGHNDHRVVMSLAVLATKFGGIIEGTEAVAKSYPAFWEKLQTLGIMAPVID